MTQTVVGIHVSGQVLGDQAEDTVGRLAAAGVTALLVDSQPSDQPAIEQSWAPRTAQRFFGGTFLPAPNPGGATDAFAGLVDLAHAAGLAVYTSLDESPSPRAAKAIPNWSEALQIDLFNRPDSAPCYRHPAYLNWWLSIVEAELKTYPLDGLYYRSERVSPLSTLLGGTGGSSRPSGVPYCFCEHCRSRAEILGINVERAQLGLQRLMDLRDRIAGRDRGGENPFVQFFGILLRYPEAMAWNNLWLEGYSGLQKEIYGVAKIISAELRVGWELSQSGSLNPWSRAENDLSELADFADFAGLDLHREGAAERLNQAMQIADSTVLAGLAPSTIEQFFVDTLGYSNQSSDARFGVDYISSEISRVRADVGPAVALLPSLDPTEPGESVAAARAAGAAGVILTDDFAATDNASALAAALGGLGELQSA